MVMEIDTSLAGLAAGCDSAPTISLPEPHTPAATGGDGSLNQPVAEMEPVSDAEEDENTVSGPASAAVTNPAELTAEIRAAIVKQVEFYCSDANLPSDKKLLRQIRKDPGGFVPVKLFANFRKVRALTRDAACISEALKDSKELVLSEDGKRVRRRVPLPDFDVEEIQRRTIVVEQLPLASTIEGVTDMFAQFGRVKLVRICSKESKGKLPVWLTGAVGAVGLHSSSGGGATSDRPHAYVEYESEENAIIAVAAMHDSEGWRPHGVQVRHLVYPCSDSPQRLAVLSQRDRDRMTSSTRTLSQRSSRDLLLSSGHTSTTASEHWSSSGGSHRVSSSGGSGAFTISSGGGSTGAYNRRSGSMAGSSSGGGARSITASEYSCASAPVQRGWTAAGAPQSSALGAALMSTPPRPPSSISAGGGSLTTSTTINAPVPAGARPSAAASGNKPGRYVPPARRSLEAQQQAAAGANGSANTNSKGRAIEPEPQVVDAQVIVAVSNTQKSADAAQEKAASGASSPDAKSPSLLNASAQPFVPSSLVPPIRVQPRTLSGATTTKSASSSPSHPAGAGASITGSNSARNTCSAPQSPAHPAQVAARAALQGSPFKQPQPGVATLIDNIITQTVTKLQGAPKAVANTVPPSRVMQASATAALVSATGAPAGSSGGGGAPTQRAPIMMLSHAGLHVLTSVPELDESVASSPAACSTPSTVGGLSVSAASGTTPAATLAAAAAKAALTSLLKPAPQPSSLRPASGLNSKSSGMPSSQASSTPSELLTSGSVEAPSSSSRDVSQGGGTGEEDDEEVQRFRQALQAASTAHPSSAHAQAQVSRAKAAQALAETNSSSGAAAQSTRPPAPRPGVPPLPPSRRSSISQAGRQAAAPSSAAPVMPEQPAASTAGAPALGADDDESDVSDGDEEYGYVSSARPTTTEGGDAGGQPGKHRRRRRRGSRAGVRSRRASQTGGGAADATQTPAHSHAGYGHGQVHGATGAGISYQPPALRSVYSAPGSRRGSMSEAGYSGTASYVRRSSNSGASSVAPGPVAAPLVTALSAAGSEAGDAKVVITPIKEKQATHAASHLPHRPHQPAAPGPIQHIAAGPDGSRGFAGGRGRGQPAKC